MSEVLAVGSKAPAFTATASDGKSYSLAEVLKKSSVALIFYPGDNTPGCNRQLSAVRDDFAKFERSGLQPFGVNPAGLDSHQKYAQEFGFQFPLLSDPDRRLAQAYHTLKDNGRSIERTVYVIGKDGAIRFGQRGAPPVTEIVAAAGA